VGCKWVYKIKHESKGNIDRFKARLVTKGFTQREGIDYNKTFLHVSSKDSFKIIMTLVTHYDLELHQIDVKTTFLIGDLYENVYMTQPKRIIVFMLSLKMRNLFSLFYMWMTFCWPAAMFICY
jgi:hypothetical protein